MKSEMSKRMLVCLCCAIVACAVSVYAAGSDAGRMWRVYFTSPGSSAPAATTPDAALIELIANAKVSINGAFYSVSSARIAQSLMAAHARGVRVRLVTDSDYFDTRAIKEIARCGIPVVGDGRRGLMHNKFAVIDDCIVWTGSFNLTDNSIERNNNNAIAIVSPELAAIFNSEFEEMFQYRVFGNRKDFAILPFLGSRYYVKIGDMNINVYFSPEDNIERILRKRLAKAKTSVHFMAFSFTSDPLAESLIRLHKKGVRVCGVMERDGSSTKESEYIKMKVEGISVKLDNNRYKMHHKVMIIDESIVVTGSYNFSRGANVKNDENVLIIEDAEIAGMYMKEFNRLYK